MARIGVYGGTFNPIHNTHIEIAKAALEQYKLDKVYFLVAGTPPHKNTAESVSDINRLEMVKLAINGQEGLDIDDRAYQLSYFAVLMKARQHDRMILKKHIQPS